MVITSGVITRERDAVKTDLATLMTYIAVGTNSTTPTSGDTLLGGETFRSTIDSVDTTSQVKEVTVTMLIDTTEANGATFYETGTFNASSGGTMVHRNVFANYINKTVDFSVLIESTIVVTVTDNT